MGNGAADAWYFCCFWLAHSPALTLVSMASFLLRYGEVIDYRCGFKPAALTALYRHIASTVIAQCRECTVWRVKFTTCSLFWGWRKATPSVDQDHHVSTQHNLSTAESVSLLEPWSSCLYPQLRPALSAPRSYPLFRSLFKSSWVSLSSYPHRCANSEFERSPRPHQLCFYT